MSGTITINSNDLLNAVKPQLLQMPEITQQPYSYIIWTDGTNYHAKNGRTGQIDFSGADAGTVIQSAINALRSMGGIIYIKSGTYSVTLSLYSGITLVGEGISTTINGTINVIGTPGSQIQKVAIENMHITGSNVNGILAQYVTQLRIRNVVLDGSLTDAISITYIDQFIIDGCLIYGVKGNGIYLSGSTISDVANGVISNTWIYNANVNGIYLQYGDSVRITNVVANNNAKNGIYVTNSMNIFVHNSIFDGNGDRGIYFNNVYSSFISDSYAGISHGSAGITLENCRATTVSATSVTNDRVGIYVYGGSDLVIYKSEVLNNNVINSGNAWENSGIVIDNHAKNIVIKGCISKNKADYPQQYQAYGIYNFNGENIIIEDCVLDGNNVAPLGGSTSGIIIKHNIGYTTVNSGKATFSGDGTTTQFKIAHGLVSTPSKILITPGSNDAKGTLYATADATYIYVNYATAPPTGTDNVVLYWYAEV